MPITPNGLAQTLLYIGNPNSPLDFWYGPYSNIDAARTATQTTIDEMSGASEIHRYVGMTVGILNGSGGVDEYWFKDGITDNDLVPKIPDIDAIFGNIKVAMFDANGGSGHQNSELTDGQGYIHLPQCVFTNNGGEFVGWGLTSADQNPMSAGQDHQMSSSTTFYAIWSDTVGYTVSWTDGTVYTITATANGQSITNGASVAAGTTVVFTCSVSTGYDFDSWVDLPSGATTSGNTATVTVSSNVSVSCRVTEQPEVPSPVITFNELQYGEFLLEVNSEQVEISGGEATAENGDSIVVTYIPIEDSYEIIPSNWEVSNTVVNLVKATNNVSFIMPNSNVDVMAVETEVPVQENLVVSFYEDEYDAEPIATLVSSEAMTLAEAVALRPEVENYISSLEGYDFDGWVEFGSSEPLPDDTMLTAGETYNLYASKTPKQYQITVSADPQNGGSATGGGSYAYGTTATVTATANNGYMFVGWNEGGTIVYSNAEFSFPVDAARTLVAVFTAIPTYTVTTSVSPSGAGTTTGDDTYQQGTNVTVTATATSGYHFVNWTENGSQVSTNPSYSFSVSANRVLVANFEEDAPDTVNVIVLSGAQKYADNLQNYLDQGQITATTHNVSVGVTSGKIGIPINTSSDSRDINGCVILFLDNYTITEADLFDSDNYVQNCEKSLGRPKNSSDSTQQTTFTYNNTVYNGYVLYQYRLTPAKIEFTITNI